MSGKRPQSDRLLVAQLDGAARHHARWRELTEAEHDAAVAALRELAAAGRGDLLAEVAGLLEGFGEGELDEPLARQAAALYRKAGADPEAIPSWIGEGRRRRAAARMPPMSGGVRGPGMRLSQKSLPGRAMARCTFPQDGPGAIAENAPLAVIAGESRQLRSAGGESAALQLSASRGVRPDRRGTAAPPLALITYVAPHCD